MSYPSISSLDEYVAWLGTFATADELANALRAEGVTGRLHKCRYCPLANLARQRGVEYPSINGYTATTGFEYRRSLPPAAREFVKMFDKGAYSDLIAIERR